MILLPILMLASVAAGENCTPVAGQRILGADLARAVPAFAPLPADIVIGYAPQPGIRRLIPGNQLVRLAEEYKIENAPLTAVCFISPLADIPQADVVQVMQASFPGDDARIDILELRPRQGPAGKIVFPRSGLQPLRPGRSEAEWRGYVEYDGQRRYPLGAMVRLTVAGERVIAVSNLPVGEPVPEDKLRVERVEGFPSSFVFAHGIKEVAGKLPRRTIPAGAPVLAADLQTPFDIAKGERVQVEVRNGHARLMLDAMAQAAGRTGDTIAVRNLASGRNFMARVEGPGRVALVLKGNTL